MTAAARRSSWNSSRVVGDPKNVWDLLDRASSVHPDRIAIVERNESSNVAKNISYQDLRSASMRLARGLASSGISKGSKVGCILFNCAEFLEIWFAVSLLGAILVPFNPSLKGMLLEYQIKDSEVQALFVDTKLKETVSHSVENLDFVTWIEKSEPGGKDHSFASLLDYPEIDEREVPAVEPDDFLNILYTSGTTGDPKGVVLSHRAYLNRAREMSELFGAGDASVFYNSLPLFHTSGQVMTTLPAILNAGTVVLEEWFHVSRFWRNAAAHHAKYSFLLMTMINALLKRKEEYVHSDLEVVLCGGATKETWTDFERSFSPIRLLEGYGMTETCGVAIFNSKENSRLGSIGKPLPSVDVAIGDESGLISRVPNSVGEILLSPKIANTMMNEYYKKPIDTEKAWSNGWLRTGDLGYLDSNGFAYFLERKKDIIRRKGENISPGDIERVVSRHENVLECSAIGIKSGLGEEEIALFMVTKKKFEDILEFLKWLDSELPYYMMPSVLNFVDSLPKTSNYKIQRSKLREGNVQVIERVDVVKLGFKPTKPLGRQ